MPDRYDLSHVRHSSDFSYLSHMNGAQLHFIFNHVPLFFALFGLIFWSITHFTQHSSLRRYALIIWIAAALGSMGAMATGEEAEEVAETWGMSHKAIHEHEEKAELAHFTCIALGLLSMILFVFEIRKIQWWKGAEGLLILLSVAVLVLMSIAAHEGGKLRHPELYQAPPTDQMLPEGEAGEAEEHE